MGTKQTPSAMVEQESAQAIRTLTQSSERGTLTAEEIAVEQVKATYCLATVLARIHEELSAISNDLPMAGRGH